MEGQSVRMIRVCCACRVGLTSIAAAVIGVKILLSLSSLAFCIVSTESAAVMTSAA